MSVNETACEYIHMYMHVGHPSAADEALYWSCTLVLAETRPAHWVTV